MTRNRPTLLLTRPETSSRRFLREVRQALGAQWRAVISPLMETRFFDAALPDHAVIVFTSETAIRAVERLSDERSATAWCVGPRTERAARNAGYRTMSGPGAARELAAAIVAAKPRGTVFCPVATDQAFDMAKALEHAGIDTISACLYTQVPQPPNAEALALLAAPEPVILPLFSARSAELAVAAFADHTAPLRVAAISAEVARRAQGLRPERTAVAPSPDAAGLIFALAALVDPPSRVEGARSGD